MKIKTNKLVSFLDKIKLSGAEIIDDAVLKFGEAGVSMEAMSKTKTSKVEGLLKKEAFIDYTARDDIGVSDLDTLSRVIKTFGEEIDISIDGNLLIISEDNRKVEVELVNTDYIDVPEDSGEREFDINVTLKAEILKDFIANVSINSDAVIKIKAIPGSLILSNTGKYKFTKTILDEKIDKEVNVEFGNPLVCVSANLENDLKISLKDNYPILIEESTEDYTIKAISAPRSNE